MVDPRENQAVNLEAVLSGLPADQETIESEIQVLRSRGLAERVVKKLKLFEDPEFNGRLKPPTFRSKLKDALSLKNLLPDGLLERLSLKTDEVPPTEEEKLIRNGRRLSRIRSPIFTSSNNWKRSSRRPGGRRNG